MDRPKMTVNRCACKVIDVPRCDPVRNNVGAALAPFHASDQSGGG